MKYSNEPSMKGSDGLRYLSTTAVVMVTPRPSESHPRQNDLECCGRTSQRPFSRDELVMSICLCVIWVGYM